MANRESSAYMLKGSYNNSDNLLDHLLRMRDISEDMRDGFLNPDYTKGVHDPFLLKDMQKVVERLIKAIDKKEHILIYSDYDADGLPGAAIIHDFFKTIGYNNISFITPDRHADGFGVHQHIVKKYIERGVTLMITIDCGIADTVSIGQINSQYPELDIIISDHHIPAEILPKAFAIINPKQSDCLYPEKMLCGAGVVWKIVSATVKYILDINHSLAPRFKTGYEKWLLDLAGMATLSDMVSLKGENRVIAYYGLVVLRKTKRPGLRALYKTNNLEPHNLLEEDITFTISPRINVASRLSDPKIALDLLTTDNYDSALELAKELNQINTKRKTMVAQTVKQAMKLIDQKYPQIKDIPIIVIGNPDWKPPILGLVATHITKHIPRPAFVWGRSEDGTIKGSIRSVPGVDVVEIMSHVPDSFFINKGGHAQSGGFAISLDMIHSLEKELLDAYYKVYKADGGLPSVESKIYSVDAELMPVDINNMTYQSINKLAPFGVENEKPLFAIKQVSIKEMKFFGKNKEHLELSCGNFKAIQFFSNYSQTDLDNLKDKKTVILIGHIEKNQFRGASEIRLRLIDIV